MRTLIVSEFVTLDGVMEASGRRGGHPHSGWVFDFFGPEQERFKLEETLAAESLLLGRVTSLVHALMGRGLVDEYRLMIFRWCSGACPQRHPRRSH